MVKGNDTAWSMIRIKIPIIILGLLLFFCIAVIPVSASKDLEIKPQKIDIVMVQKIPFLDTVKNFNLTSDNSTNINSTNTSSPPLSVSCFLPLGENETRTILINNNQNASLSNLTITALDLVTKDNHYVISPGMISANYTNTTIGPNGFMTIPVIFNLADAHSGEYEGVLQISSDATSDSLPVDIQIKDAWLFPFLVLVIVTYFSVVVSRYISSGKERDRMKVKIGRIRQKFLDDDILNYITHEPDFLRFIREPIKNTIDDTYLCLSLNDNENANKKYIEAERLWKQWSMSGFRKDWELCLIKSETILVKTNNYHNDKDRLKGFWINAAKEVQNPTADLIKHPERPVLTLNSEIDQILNEIENPQKGKLPNANDNEDEDKRLTWYEKFKLNILHFWSIVSGLIIVLLWGILVFFLAPPLEVPVLYLAWIIEFIVGVLLFICYAHWGIRRDISRLCSNIWPEFWLKVYTGITGVFLPAMFLIFIGFTELYSKQPTFGANGAADYIALVLWAFGTGPTAEKFTQLVQGYKEVQKSGKNGGLDGDPPHQ